MDHKCHKAEIIESMKKTLDGNGRPGLRDTVSQLVTAVEGLNKRLDRMDQRGRFNISTLIAIGSLVIATVAILSK